MIKNPKVVISTVGVFHIALGLILSNFWFVSALGEFYLIMALLSKVKVVKDNLENVKFLSLITLVTTLFGLISTYRYSNHFTAYLIITLMAVPIGTGLLRSYKQLNFYCSFTAILSLFFTAKMTEHQYDGITAAFIFSLGFVYLLSRKKISLEQQEKRNADERNKLINNCPDIIIKRNGDVFSSINFYDFNIDVDLKNKIEDMIARGSTQDYGFVIGDKTYDLKLSSPDDTQEVFIFLRDVTDKHSQSKELEENRTKLTNSSKLAALGEMAGGVAHEINNPLQILSLSNEQMRVLMMNENLNVSREEFEKLCDQQESTIERINNIVKGMKLISRDGHQDPYELVDLKDLLKDTLSFCNEKFKNNGVNIFIFEEEHEKYLIEAQRVRLSQVILNILNNAFDAIQSNNKKVIRVYLSKSDDNVRLGISDNGSGVPEELIQKIFQPFFTTKEIGKGTGLGLSISKGIIEQHRGRFYIDEEDRSKFIIDIPQAKEA